jgi:hypothetical protein
MPETIQTETSKKIIFEFKHTDEQGNPIIDPRTGQQAFTNLAADTQEEMNEKMKQSYLNVMRALARVRGAKPVAKEPERSAVQMTPEQERQLVTEVVDPVKGREAIRKLAGVEDLEKSQAKTKEMQDAAAAERASYQFMNRHMDDYFRCAANGKLISDYIKENDLDPRVADNYEIAFQNVQHRLAERPAPPKVEPEIPEPPKRQAAGGIQPGELSGHRTIQRTNEKSVKTKDGPLTLEKLKWLKNTDEGRAEWKRRAKTDPSFYPAVNALLAKT